MLPYVQFLRLVGCPSDSSGLACPVPHAEMGAESWLRCQVTQAQNGQGATAEYPLSVPLEGQIVFISRRAHGFCPIT